MWLLRKPTPRQMDAFLAEQRPLVHSYAEIGQSDRETPPGYNLDHNRVALGYGGAAFEAGCDLLRRWRMFPPGWTQIHPPDASIERGSVVAVLARAFGFWWLNACRIVFVIDEDQPVRRFGFAYGTLPGHAERGEERFCIEWLADDSVHYDIRAFSRPRFWPAKLAGPLARRLQRRFARDSLSAMARQVEARTR